MDTITIPIDALEAALAALAGDGSVATLPDVTPAQAVVWITEGLHAAGFEIRRRSLLRSICCERVLDLNELAWTRFAKALGIEPHR